MQFAMPCPSRSQTDSDTSSRSSHAGRCICESALSMNAG